MRTNGGAALWVSFVFVAAPAAGAPCESLASLQLPDTTITTAQTVAAGAFSLPAAPAGKGKGKAADSYRDLPAFCRVAATLRPTSDSDIKIEVWLPEANWNRKYQAVGNGGWAGVISYPAMAQALRRGYATSSTDTGHTGGSGSFVLGHPEKLIDYGWRSEHEMTLKAKAIVDAFYGSGPRFSYWNGCSTGGRQGLQEAQRFPNDFDGIIAGAAANRTLLAMWIGFAALKDPASFIPPEKYPMIHQAVLNACDARDGVKDGLIEDPTRCKFDPKVLLCKGADGPSCLTTAQVEAARKILSSPPHPTRGGDLFPPLVPGTELGWGVQAGGPELTGNMLDHYRYVVFKDPNWDWRTFRFDVDVPRVEAEENNIMNATNPNLRPYFSRNGKLLMYHGWSDTNVPGLSSVRYYKNVVDTLGGPKNTANSIRLFMAPGMGHCGGGEGPNQFDLVSALEEWVEGGKAPDRIIASRTVEGKVVRTRPLCPYPQVAKYKGSGSVDDAANFTCSAP
jgi:feruloyl esterase